MSNGHSRFLLRIFLLRVYAERSEGRGKGGGEGGSASLSVDRCRCQTHHAAYVVYFTRQPYVTSDRYANTARPARLPILLSRDPNAPSNSPSRALSYRSPMYLKPVLH